MENRGNTVGYGEEEERNMGEKKREKESWKEKERGDG